MSSIASAKHRPGERPAAEIAKARIRLVIESVFANLKRQTGPEDHLAKTIGGLVQRIAQRLLALTIGMFPQHPHRTLAREVGQSQFFRRELLRRLGVGDRWDYWVFPREDNVRRTLARFGRDES